MATGTQTVEESRRRPAHAGCQDRQTGTPGTSGAQRHAAGAQRRGIGLVRAALARIGLTRQSDRFRRHGTHRPDPQAPLVLVACSGGRDSLALAALTHIVAGELGLRAGAVLLDHGLQEGSAQVTARAAVQCRGIGLEPVIMRRLAVDPHLRRSQGTEAAARRARYDALADAARSVGARAVLLAHTQDDQAETLLLALLAGSSPRALAGMPDQFRHDGVCFLRPILGLTRAQTTAVCRAEGLGWWDDPTNGEGTGPDDPRYDALPLRSRVRQGVVPLLRRLGGAGVEAHLADIAAQQRLDQDFLDRQADKAFERLLRDDPPAGPQTGDCSRLALDTNCVRLALDTQGLRALPPALRTRVLVSALARLLAQDAGARGGRDSGIRPCPTENPTENEDTKTGRGSGGQSRADLRTAGISRESVMVLDRWVTGRVPTGILTISSNLSAYRQGAVTVLCHNNFHADR